MPKYKLVLSNLSRTLVISKSGRIRPSITRRSHCALEREKHAQNYENVNRASIIKARLNQERRQQRGTDIYDRD